MHKDLYAIKGSLFWIKPLEIEDAHDIHQFASDPEVSKYIGWPLMVHEEETHAYVHMMIERHRVGTHVYASLVSIDNNQIIGTLMLFAFDHEAKHAELGYVLSKDYWSRGIMGQAIAGMDQYAKETLKLKRLFARVVSANRGSGRILERNHYKIEGQLRDYYCINGTFSDCLIYAKTL